jgi:hypothetical protein
MTIADIQWDDEHPLFTGTFFGGFKIGKETYTVGKGAMFGGGYTIGGKIDGEYQEIDVATAEELDKIIATL